MQTSAKSGAKGKIRDEKNVIAAKNKISEVHWRGIVGAVADRTK